MQRIIIILMPIKPETLKVLLRWMSSAQFLRWRHTDHFSSWSTPSLEELTQTSWRIGWCHRWMSKAHSPIFHHFTYVTTHSPTLLSLYLCHSLFSNPSIASSTSQFILQAFCLSHKQGLLSTNSIKVTSSYLNNVHILTKKPRLKSYSALWKNERDWFKPGKDCQNNKQVTVTDNSLPACERSH